MVAQYDRPSLRQKKLSKWSIRQAIHSFMERLLPSIFIIVLSLIFAAPFRIPGQSELQVGLIMGTVWFWALYRPALMPIGFLFLSGIVAEFFVATPPGLLLLWMLVVYGVARTARFHFARSGFFQYWGMYSLTVLVGAVSEWCLFSMRAMMPLSPFAVIFQWILSIGIYPFLHVAFVWGRRFFYSSRHL